MKGIKKTNQIWKAIIAIAVALVFVLPGSGMFANNEKSTAEINGISVVKIDMQKITVQGAYFSMPFEYVPQTLDTNPAFNGSGDQLHPAFGRTAVSEKHMAAYRDDDLEDIVWTFSADDGISYDLGVYYGTSGDYPSVKLWKRSRFFGTFVTDSDDHGGGVTYLFECTDPSDYDSYSLIGWDFSGIASNMTDADIACDSSQNPWEWGVSTYVVTIHFGHLTWTGAPVTVYADPEDETGGWMRIPFIENCNHTDIDIDHENITAYLVYDQDKNLTGDWTLLCNVMDFEDIEGGYHKYFEITGAGNLQYPVVAVDDDNLVILAETDENGNKDIICLYSDMGISNLQTSFVADSTDDEMYPDIRHVKGTTFICTFVKEGSLYISNTTDGGATWSIPEEVTDNVVTEYKNTDICDFAAKSMFEVNNSVDIDIYIGDIGGGINDTTPPEISNVQATPSPQASGGHVNITATVIDNIEEDTVYLHIFYPDNSVENFSITQNKTSDTYYCNKIYDQVGVHTFHIWANDTSGNTVVSTDYAFKIVLNDPPYIPGNPNPEDRETDVSVDADLSWTGGDPDGDTVTYDVYFGTTNPPPKVASNQSDTFYDPGTINYSTTYYWKIIAWDIYEVFTEGPIWNFTTLLDTQPPVTSHEFDGTMGENNWYVSDVIVTLTATDDLSGVSYTMYKLDDGNWKPYINLFPITRDDIHTLEYYSVDYVGNIEDVNGPFTVKIDQIPPEIDLTVKKIGLRRYKFIADVSDATSEIDRVEFYYADELLGIVTEYPYEWIYPGPIGQNAKTIVYDNAGNSAEDEKPVSYSNQYIPSFLERFIQRFPILEWALSLLPVFSRILNLKMR